MVAAKSVPQNNPADYFEAVLRPPLDETPAQRDTRIRAEQNAKRVSDAIDEQLRTERADLKRKRADVKILLLGQSESGKSTTLKRMSSTPAFSLDMSHMYLLDVPVCPLNRRTPAFIHTSLLKLTHIPEFQLLHTPAAFQAERVAWRIVIYLNLIRSVRRYIPLVTPTPVHWLIAS